MTDDLLIADDAFANGLAAIDDAMAAGRQPTAVPEATPPDLRDRLTRGMAALRDLRQLRPVRAGSVSDGVSSPVAHVSGLDHRIGRFTIIRELGRGGFGVVFLAHDPTLHRDIALKVPHARSLVDVALRDRFRREALAAAGLDHPNLVPVHEVDDVGPVCYIASAYVPGPSLAEWLSRRPAVSAVEAAAFVATLAEAVAHAHGRGVLHRDLKPANVLLQIADCNLQNVGDGETGAALQIAIYNLKFAIPKITDFGLARIAADPERPTRTGASLGTPGYMAPEQAVAARDAGPAVDVYALGAILYELLTGRPPFRGETDLDTLRQAAEREPVSPRHLRPGLPRDLDTICLKCLEKNPGARYGSASDLCDDLRRFVAGKPVTARRVGIVGRTNRWCRRKPVVAGLIAALVAAIGIGAGGMIREYRRAENERDAAVAERDRGRRLLDQANGALSRLHTLGEDLYGNTQTQARGRDVLNESLKYAQALIAEGGEDPRLRRAAARAAISATRTLRDLAEYGQAEGVCRQAIAILDALKAADPDDRTLRQDFAYSHHSLAHIFWSAGRGDEARAAYRRAEELFGELVNDGSATVEDHRFQLLAALDQARIDMGTIPWETTVRTMSAIIERQRAALMIFPNDRDMSLNLAMALDWLSAAYFEWDRFTEAEKYCRESLELRKKLLAEKPASVAARIGLALSWSRLGGILAGSGRWANAEAPYLEGTRVYSQLVAGAPHNPMAHQDFSRHLVVVARMYKKLNRPVEYAEQFRKLVTIRAQLVRLQPGSARRKTELAWAHYHLADAAFQLGEMTTARNELAAAAQLIAANPPADQAADLRRLVDALAEMASRLESPTRPVKPASKPTGAGGKTAKSIVA